MEQNRRARIVKRAPLYKRIIDAPEDYLTKVENDLRALDWDLLQEGFRYHGTTTKSLFIPNADLLLHSNLTLASSTCG